PTPQPAAIQTRPASGQTMPGTLTYASATMATSAISRNSTTMSMPPIGPHRTTRTSPIGRRASSGHPRFALELALDLREIGKWSFQPREQERCETPEEDFVVRRLVRVDGLTRAELGDELQRVGTGERVGERAHDEVQPPRELLLRKLGERARERGLETRDHRRVLFGKESADERRGVRIRASEKAQEVLAAALVIAREPQRRDEERHHDPFARQRPAPGARFQRGEKLQTRQVHWIEAPRQHRLEKLLLAAEVIVGRGEIHVGRGGDRTQARCLEAVLHEERLGDVEDARARRSRITRADDNGVLGA